jgi:hypothetical protein
MDDVTKIWLKRLGKLFQIKENPLPQLRDRGF